MSFKINKILEKSQALPSQDNWNELQLKFREKYREMEAYMADPNNNTQERTPELARMDLELCDLFEELHDIEIVDSEAENVPEPVIEETKLQEIETENQVDKPVDIVELKIENLTENDMKKQKSPILEAEKVEEPKELETGGIIENQQIEPNIESNGGATEKSTTIQSSDVPPPAFNIQQPIQGFPEFLAYAQTQQNISAKDLVKYKIPDALWRTNKIEFVLGNLKFRKTVASLIFNRWEVVK
jgi:hypothetical protein